MKRYRHKKPYRIKKKKSILRNKFFWLAVLIVLLIGSIFYFVFLSSFFQIKEIKIQGNAKISNQKIEDIISQEINNKILFFIQRNIVSIDSKKINKIILEKFPEIVESDLKRKFPDMIVVDIKERNPVGVWCNNECFKFDEQAIIFEKGEEQGLIIKSEKEIILGKQIIEKKKIDNILEIQDQLKEKIKIDIKDFFITNEGEKMIVKILDGWEIYFNLDQDVSKQIFNLNLVLKEKIPPEIRGNLKYIDLRFGNKVYYKYKESTEDSSIDVINKD